MAQTTSKKQTTPKPKKLSLTLEAEQMAELEAYLLETGVGKEAFVRRAIAEKISREKISRMIDGMIR